MKKEVNEKELNEVSGAAGEKNYFDELLPEICPNCKACPIVRRHFKGGKVVKICPQCGKVIATL